MILVEIYLDEVVNIFRVQVDKRQVDFFIRFEGKVPPTPRIRIIVSRVIWRCENALCIRQEMVTSIWT